MFIRHLLPYWDWLLLLLVAIGCFWADNRAAHQFDMATKYNAGWVSSCHLP